MNADYRSLFLSQKPALIQGRIRQALRRSQKLKRTLQGCRAVVHYGPWSHAARAMIRMARPPQEEAAKQSASLVQLDCGQLVEILRTEGTALAGVLPSDLLRRVCEATDKLPPGEYSHLNELPDVRTLVQCAAVMAVVRGYLRAEPVLLECNLVVAHAEDPDMPVRRDSQRRFHFDYAGWSSLNLFTYLTDVSQDSGAHQVIIGTHRSRKAWDAVRGVVPDDEIEDRFPNRLRTVTGRAGTMFFEDTSAFHRRKMHTRRRAMLNILWASHRNWLSKERLVPKYSDFFRLH